MKQIKFRTTTNRVERSGKITANCTSIMFLNKQVGVTHLINGIPLEYNEKLAFKGTFSDEFIEIDTTDYVVTLGANPNGSECLFVLKSFYDGN